MAAPIVNSTVPVTHEPRIVMKTFTRTCGCSESLMHTVGDTAQAARYESTACSTCRTPIRFKAGWGRS